MSTLLGSTRKNPTEKYESITQFSHDFFAVKSLKNWGIIIEAEPMEI